MDLLCSFVIFIDNKNTFVEHFLVDIKHSHTFTKEFFSVQKKRSLLTQSRSKCNRCIFEIILLQQILPHEAERFFMASAQEGSSPQGGCLFCFTSVTGETGLRSNRFLIIKLHQFR